MGGIVLWSTIRAAGAGSGLADRDVRCRLARDAYERRIFVLIDLIAVIDGRLTVRVWEIRPGSYCPTTRGLTHPLHAVAAPAHAGMAGLVKRVAYEDCEGTGY